MKGVGITKAEMIVRFVRAMPEGEHFTASELSVRMHEKYPKANFSPCSVGNILTRYCSDILIMERNTSTWSWEYTRNEVGA